MYLQWITQGLEKPGKTKGGLAKALRLHPSQVTRLLSEGGRRLKADELDQISRYIEEPVPTRRSLVDSFDPDETNDADVPPIDVRASGPAEAIYELVAAGGLGSGQVIVAQNAGEMHTVDEVKEDYWRFPSYFVRNVIGAEPIHMVAVECQGDSMEPTLSPGERVWVNTRHNKPTPDGLYAIRDALDAVIVKRLELTESRPPRVRIISDNPRHSPREVDLDEIAIIGKVVCGLRLF